MNGIHVDPYVTPNKETTSFYLETQSNPPVIIVHQCDWLTLRSHMCNTALVDYNPNVNCFYSVPDSSFPTILL